MKDMDMIEMIEMVEEIDMIEEESVDMKMIEKIGLIDMIEIEQIEQIDMIGIGMIGLIDMMIEEGEDQGQGQMKRGDIEEDIVQVSQEEDIEKEVIAIEERIKKGDTHQKARIRKIHIRVFMKEEESRSL